ncbi:P2X receptor [Pelomyxa schiedti]|nr:P2X receptor [Pelomyxa schiedti]
MGSTASGLFHTAFDGVKNALSCYSTVQVVKIKDWRLASIHWFVCTVIVLYIGLVTILWNKNYLYVEDPDGTVRFQLDPPESYMDAEDLAYCSQSTLPLENFTKYPCIYWDENEVRFPTTEDDSITVTSRTDAEYQALPSCDRTENGCQFETISNQTSQYIADLEHFQIRIDHSFFASHVGIASNGRFLFGEMLDSNGDEMNLTAYPNCIGQTGLWDTLEVQTVLKACGYNSLDDHSPVLGSGDSMRDSGIVIYLTITYSNKYSFNLNNIKYTMSAALLPQTKYKSNEIQYNSDRSQRYLQERHAIHIVAFQVGTLCEFDFAVLLLTFIGGFGLMVFATTIVDILATTVFPNHAIIQLAKTQTTCVLTDKKNVPLLKRKLNQFRLDVVEDSINDRHGDHSDLTRPLKADSGSDGDYYPPQSS